MGSIDLLLLSFRGLRVGLQTTDQRHVVPRLPLQHPVTQQPLNKLPLPLNCYLVQDGIETGPDRKTHLLTEHFRLWTLDTFHIRFV